eukprot:3262918-Pyramimonas_sp.AAC.1
MGPLCDERPRSARAWEIGEAMGELAILSSVFERRMGRVSSTAVPLYRDRPLRPSAPSPVAARGAAIELAPVELAGRF